MSANGHSAFGQTKKDAHQKLQALERWSARATLLILLGIVVDKAIAGPRGPSTARFPTSFLAITSAVCTSLLLGIDRQVPFLNEDMFSLCFEVRH